MYSRRIVYLAVVVSLVASENLPSFITPCDKNGPADSFYSCMLQQAKNALPYFAKGIPELGLEPIDPVSIKDLDVITGNLKIKQRNLILKGLKNMDIKELRWDLEQQTGHLRAFGNLTMNCNYEMQGQLLIIPVSGTGKLTVKMDDTEISMKYKLKKIQGADGKTHLATYDLKAKQTYGRVRFHMVTDSGDNLLSNTINQVMNDNWKELIKEFGPPHTKAVSTKVSNILNIFYSKIPYEQLLP